MSRTNEQIVETYQCPGCVAGMDTTCGSYRPGTNYDTACQAHVPGTSMLGGPRILLGLPKGFNRLTHGFLREGTTTPVRILRDPEYDDFNVPVWAAQSGNDTVVRTYLPRLGAAYIDVVPDTCPDDIAPMAVDPSNFDMD